MRPIVLDIIHLVLTKLMSATYPDSNTRLDLCTHQSMSAFAAMLHVGYRPHLPWRGLLESLLQALLVHAQLEEAELMLHGHDTLRVRRDSHGTAAHSLPAEVTLERGLYNIERTSSHTPEPDHAVRTYSIGNEGGTLGELRAHSSASEATAWSSSLCAELAGLIALLVQRHAARRWSEQHLHRPLTLVGVSPVLRELDWFITRTGRSHLPVLLSGEPGTEKRHVAAAIHCVSRCVNGPFVEVSCNDACDTPLQWMEQARNGTLVLEGVEHLNTQHQVQLLQCARWWLASLEQQPVRLIATTSVDLQQLVKTRRFSKRLLQELECLRTSVPPLRTRVEDIESLVMTVLARHHERPEHKCTPTLIGLCQAYAWPENLSELERVITRLAVLTGDLPIQHADVRQYAPWLVEGQAVNLSTVPIRVAVKPTARSIEHWVRSALAGDVKDLERLHEALQKALLYVGRHFAQSISLGQLAGQAHVSASHLTYLFRTELGVSFKQFLGALRVYKAQELLSQPSRRRITDVALSVGFGDLSHFEKTFRRIAGQSAREFRRAVTNERAADVS